MADIASAVAEFWDFFLQSVDALVELGIADDGPYDAILERLQRVDPGLYFEFSTAPGAREVIITAEGEKELFPVVESVVAGAPPLQGWTAIALKPKIGFPVTARWEAVVVTISDVVFESLELQDAGELGLRLFLPDIQEGDIEAAHNAVLRAIDHGLGERQFAETVSYTDLHQLPDNARPEDYTQLNELERFIEWRESKRS